MKILTDYNPIMIEREPPKIDIITQKNKESFVSDEVINKLYPEKYFKKEYRYE